MTKITIKGIIKTSIVTAFTIAVALIWKDVISEAIVLLFPIDTLLYKFLTAIIATIIVVIAIYVILKTEEETEIVWHKLTYKNKKNANLQSKIKG